MLFYKRTKKMSENNTNVYKELSYNDRYEHEFKEEALLGNGCFGVVYKALNLKEGQYYAIKIIDFNEFYLNKTPEKFKDECLKEIRLMETLKEDYVVNYIRSWSEYEDMFYIQMELCETDLKHVLQQLRKGFKRNPILTTSSIKYYISSELFHEILEALNYLHSQNPPIIHRDLKPSNILITNGAGGRFIKLADFGLAFIHNYEKEKNTQDRGTLAYMAPEVENGRYYDTRDDVYSLGLIARKLFNLSSNISINELLLTEKYSSVQNLITTMISEGEEIEKRPNCQQILDSEKLWYFNIETFYNDSIYKNIIESKHDQPMKDSFLEYFIRTKDSKRTVESVNELLSVYKEISREKSSSSAKQISPVHSKSYNRRYEQEFKEETVLWEWEIVWNEEIVDIFRKSRQKEKELRKKYVKNLYNFCEEVELNDAFMKELKKHSNYEYIEEVLKYDNEMAQKTFIFLEFTKERSTCNEMVEILLKSGQKDASEVLDAYNNFEPFIPISYEMVDILLKSNKSGIEQQEQRKSFLENLYDLCEEVELNDAFMEELKKHSNYEYIEEVLKYDNEMARKTFIFLEFTKERSTCNEMVEILLKSGQKDASELLDAYNTFAPFIPISNEIELPITQATVLRSGGPKYFPMSQKPRGMCIIINNVKDVLGKESLRFRNIFEQLSFVVELWYDLSATEIEERLIELSKENRLSGDNALIVMTISHGDHEKIIGADASELRIRKIVDIFSKSNCKALSMKPKLFFFNSCRIKDENVVVTATNYTKQNKIITDLENFDRNWIYTNKSTLICSTCAEGYNSWFIPNELTLFGQALSHSIAQYSCEESVKSILKITSERMSEIGSPEIFWSEMPREIYFNPGLPLDYQQTII